MQRGKRNPGHAKDSCRLGSDHLSRQSSNGQVIPSLWREELESDPDRATSANSYSWILKGAITREFLSDCNMTLSLGCGFGRELVQLSSEAIGVEIDHKLAITAKRISRRQVVRGDAHHLPFRDAVFDGLAMAEVIEHLNSPLSALREINRVLATSGKLALQTPNRLVTLGIAISKKYGHVHEFTYPEISKYLDRAGFAIVKRTGSTIPYIPSTSRLGFLNEKTSFRFWKWINRRLKITTWDIIILSRKRNTL